MKQKRHGIVNFLSKIEFDMNGFFILNFSFHFVQKVTKAMNLPKESRQDVHLCTTYDPG